MSDKTPRRRGGQSAQRPGPARSGGRASGPPPRKSGRPPRSGGSEPRRDSPRREPAAPRLERLNKVLAKAGLGSRRAVEELIVQGRVSVDGAIVRDLATKVDPFVSRVEVDGERIKAERHVYVAVHKPKGYVTTHADPAGRPRVIDLVPGLAQRVYPIGRLDEESTGLILLTNDGTLAHKLAHPRYGVEKVYRALVAGQPGPEVLEKLGQGIWLSDGKARAKRARFAGRQGEATVLELTLAEGKNREVRRMLAKLGHKVMGLTRIAVGPIRLKGLSVGQWRYLEPREVGLLRRAAAGEAVAGPGNRRGDSKRGGAKGRSAAPRKDFQHLIGTAGETDASAGPGATSRADRSGRGGNAGPKRAATPQAKPSGSKPPRSSKPPTSKPPKRAARADHERNEVVVDPLIGEEEGGAGPKPGRGGRPAGRPPKAGSRGRGDRSPSATPPPRRIVGLEEDASSGPPSAGPKKPSRRKRPKPLQKPRRRQSEGAPSSGKS